MRKKTKPEDSNQIVSSRTKYNIMMITHNIFPIKYKIAAKDLHYRCHIALTKLLCH